jgi:hypothetical protein
MNSGSSPWAPRYLELAASAGPLRICPRAPKSLDGPETRELPPVSAPLSCAMMRSIGPPGANCTTVNEISMMPNRVGIISNRRRAI